MVEGSNTADRLVRKENNTVERLARYTEKCLREKTDPDFAKAVAEAREELMELHKTLLVSIMERGRLEVELEGCRNELCLKCGFYRDSHKGACDGCRWKRGKA